jgi:hypothetical protein
MKGAGMLEGGIRGVWLLPSEWPREIPEVG